MLEEALKDVVETLTCCVCVDSEINTTLVPCGHLFCAECASRLPECPLCRKQVMAKQRIYYPTCRDDTDMRSVSLKVVSSPVHHQSYKKRRKRDLNTSVEPWYIYCTCSAVRGHAIVESDLSNRFVKSLLFLDWSVYNCVCIFVWKT